jgi:hypothetical protein
MLTDEKVCNLDIIPEILPNLFLRRARHVNQIATDLNVRTIDDRQFGPELFYQGNETGHLRIVWKSVP